MNDAVWVAFLVFNVSHVSFVARRWRIYSVSWRQWTGRSAKEHIIASNKCPSPNTPSPRSSSSNVFELTERTESSADDVPTFKSQIIRTRLQLLKYFLLCDTAGQMNLNVSVFGVPSRIWCQWRATTTKKAWQTLFLVNNEHAEKMFLNF